MLPLVFIFYKPYFITYTKTSSVNDKNRLFLVSGFKMSCLPDLNSTSNITLVDSLGCFCFLGTSFCFLDTIVVLPVYVLTAKLKLVMHILVYVVTDEA